MKNPKWSENSPSTLNIIGKKYYSWTVVLFLYIRCVSKPVFKCQCDCGNFSNVYLKQLVRGESKSCGCKRLIGLPEDFIGKKYNRWEVISFSHKDKNYKIFHHCKCECGTLKVMMLNTIRYGKSTSCGCFHSEQLTLRNLKHGHTANGITTPEYQTYQGIFKRCYNKKYKDFNNYGGRGIVVCDRWLDSFDNFLQDMGQRPSILHSLDRWPDNDGNYSPDNCRWATKKEQNRNKRNTHYETYNGETKCVAEWADFFTIRPEILYKRLRERPIEWLYPYYVKKYGLNINSI